MRPRCAILTAAALCGALAARQAPAAEPITSLRIFKGKHRLEAYSGKKLVKVYRVSVGKGAKGPKLYEGDNRTPEGSYRIDSRHRSKRYKLFLHISYPNAADRRRHARAKRAGKIPRSARLGGDVGIHGEKRGWSWLPHKWLDWTRGCIAVDDDEIKELYSRVKQGARVEILP